MKRRFVCLTAEQRAELLQKSVKPTKLTSNNAFSMVGHTFEYSPAVNELHKLVQAGELGKIYSVELERVNLGLFRNDFNVIWDLAPHDISILLYL